MIGARLAGRFLPRRPRPLFELGERVWAVHDAGVLGATGTIVERVYVPAGEPVIDMRNGRTVRGLASWTYRLDSAPDELSFWSERALRRSPPPDRAPEATTWERLRDELLAARPNEAPVRAPETTENHAR